MNDVVDLTAPRITAPADRKAKGITGAVEPAEGWSTWNPEPGWLYTDVPEETYHRSKGISKSGLDLIGVRKTNRGGSPIALPMGEGTPERADRSDGGRLGGRLLPLRA